MLEDFLRSELLYDKNTVCMPRQRSVTTDVVALVGQVGANHCKDSYFNYGFTTPLGSKKPYDFLLYSYGGQRCIC